MTEFTSKVKDIPYNVRSVFSILSDMSNLERFKDRIPEEDAAKFSCDTDSFHLETPTGKITFRIVNRDPDKTIKFRSSDSPFLLNLWIQLKPESEQATKMKMTLRIDLNPVLKSALSKMITEGLDKISDALAAIPYE
jgi:ribosome-associated toxin RatA of RatAB toxin-antitoxin module